jgi:hypothetical protein
MLDHWPACGWNRLQTDDRGWLRPTDGWLRLFLERPEMALVPESCPGERRLHDALVATPHRAVPAAELAAVQDADMRENYGHFLALRDGLQEAGTLQAWLLTLFRGGAIRTPPLFIDIVVQAVVRQLLQDRGGIAAGAPTEATAVRAAELLFRPQRITLHEGRVLAGDREALDLHHETQGFGELGRLLTQAKAPVKGATLQVLSADNEAAFLDDAAAMTPRRLHLLDLTADSTREIGHGLSFHLASPRSGLKALGLVLQWWVQHLCGVEVTIRPVPRIDDPRWRWHIGLDAEASALLDELYRGERVDEARLRRLIGLFRLDFVNPAEMRPDVAGRPVYLGLMMNPEQGLRLKPQNLLLNLPLAEAS